MPAYFTAPLTEGDMERHKLVFFFQWGQTSRCQIGVNKQARVKTWCEFQMDDVETWLYSFGLKMLYIFLKKSLKPTPACFIKAN